MDTTTTHVCFHLCMLFMCVCVCVCVICILCVGMTSLQMITHCHGSVFKTPNTVLPKKSVSVRVVPLFRSSHKGWEL